MHVPVLALAGIVVACCTVSSGLTLMALGGGAEGAFLGGAGVVIGGVLMLLSRPPKWKERPPLTPEEHAEAPTVRDRAVAQFDARPPGPRAPVAGALEATIAQDFVPDFSAQAVTGLGEIYRELQRAEVYGYLLVVAGPDRQRSMPIGAQPVTIGRGPHNSWQLRDGSVSQSQLSVFVQGGRVVARDCGSKNGSYLNNQRFHEQALENCDVLAMGSTKILVTVG